MGESGPDRRASGRRRRPAGDPPVRQDRVGAARERAGRQLREEAAVVWPASERFTAGEDGERVLASTRRGLYLAIPPGRSVESYHFQEARHGHTEKLLPDPSLLERFEQQATPTWLAPAAAERTPEPKERAAFAEITPERIAADLARYVGREAIDDGAPAYVAATSSAPTTPWPSRRLGATSRRSVSP